MAEQEIIPEIDGAGIVVYAQFLIDGVFYNIPLLKEVTPLEECPKNPLDGAFYSIPLLKEVIPLEECPENPQRMTLDVTTFTPVGLSSRPWTVLLADGRGELVEKRAGGFVNNGREIVTNFSRKVPVGWSEKYECFTTKPQDNNLHLVGIDSLGRIVVYQAAIVSQEGKFFATLQQLGAHQAVWNGAGVCFPTVDWPQLNDWLTERFDDWQQGEDGILPEPSPLLSNCADEKGRATNRSVVLFWNLARGFGAIKTPSGIVARVHWTQAPQRDGLRYLKRGELAEYFGLVPAQQTQAIHGSSHETSFKWEARGMILSESEFDGSLGYLSRFKFDDEEHA
ncbi:MAG: hypothetical protein WCT16_02465 [Candidatus Buchananbacteria bacterium]